MRILLSNDDGYFAPGLECLAATLAEHAEITVVAPERDRSGASNSLTLDRPLTVRRAPNGFLFVNGTPTDCVHLAVTGLLDHLPDMVISGINLGANMGDDTIYSGTVAAATEGYLLGIPSIAVSLASKIGRHFETAASVVVELLQRQREQPSEAWLLNVNVPDVPESELKGRRVTRQMCTRPHSHQAQTPRGGLLLGRWPACRCRRRHRLPCGGAVLRLGDAAADGSYASCRDGARERVARGPDAGSTRMIAGVEKFDGIGMTSARTRTRMVERLREQGIVDESVLSAMAAVPRHIFVEEALAIRAYEDSPLPIGAGQTISQPYVVARMTELLHAGGTRRRVLEIGTGCGYQTAILALLSEEVYTVERIGSLVAKARRNLRALQLSNIRIKHGDGSTGLARTHRRRHHHCRGAGFRPRCSPISLSGGAWYSR